MKTGPACAELKEIARTIRKKTLTMHFEARANHIGSGLSAIDILTYLYYRWLRPQDRFILSKGHAASSLYATLWARGVMSDESIRTYYRDGTTLPAHPVAGAHPAIPAATGSLGHGLSIGVGMAYANKYLSEDGSRIACLLSDGECNEGATWEAALFAGHHRLQNLLVVIDANGIQGFGRTQDVLNLEPLVRKWEAFGFSTDEIDGHDFQQFNAVLGQEQSPANRGPRCVICRTVKGKGVSFMENTVDWHYLTLSAEQYDSALFELEHPGDNGIGVPHES